MKWGEEKEKKIDYLSKTKTLFGYETRYSTIEKTCLALVWATQRLLHYIILGLLNIAPCSHGPIYYSILLPPKETPTGIYTL